MSTISDEEMDRRESERTMAVLNANIAKADAKPKEVELPSQVSPPQKSRGGRPLGYSPKKVAEEAAEVERKIAEAKAKEEKLFREALLVAMATFQARSPASVRQAVVVAQEYVAIMKELFPS